MKEMKKELQFLLLWLLVLIMMPNVNIQYFLPMMDKTDRLLIKTNKQNTCNAKTKHC